VDSFVICYIVTKQTQSFTMMNFGLKAWNRSAVYPEFVYILNSVKQEIPL